MKVLLTGSAGFIGFHLAKKLLDNNTIVIGIDNINQAYDLDLKKSRLKILAKNKNFKFYKLDITNKLSLEKLFKKEKFSHVIHMAAQAGVRDSIEKPELFINSNIVGFGNIIELSVKNNIKKFAYASSSSVYGLNKTKPSDESEKCEKPASIYGATKKANELIAHTYSHIHNLSTIGLRFFTVYGPWGRPDMALFKFTDAIFKKKKIDIYNYGDMKRDFTYIDDVVEAVIKIILSKKKNKTNYEVFNIGSGKIITLKKFIKTLEDVIEIKAKKRFLPMQKGDVKDTLALNTRIEKQYNYKVNHTLREGLSEFIKWYRSYYN